MTCPFDGAAAPSVIWTSAVEEHRLILQKKNPLGDAARGLGGHPEVKGSQWGRGRAGASRAAGRRLLSRRVSLVFARRSPRRLWRPAA